MRLSRPTTENRASITHQNGFPAARDASIHSSIVRPHSDAPNVAERCVWSQLPPSRAACSANTRWRTWTADECQHDSTQPKTRNATGKANDEGPRRLAQTPDVKALLVMPPIAVCGSSFQNGKPRNVSVGMCLHKETLVELVGQGNVEYGFVIPPFAPR